MSEDDEDLIHEAVGACCNALDKKYKYIIDEKFCMDLTNFIENFIEKRTES